MNNLRSRFRAFLAAAALAAAAAAAAGSPPALAEEITGAMTMSADQPQIYLNLRRAPDDPPLSVREGKESTFAIKCFLDTGASGIVLSRGTADALRIRPSKTQQGTDVLFEDIGVGGAEHFQVSEPLYAALAPFSSVADGDNADAYGNLTGPLRIQLRPDKGLLDMLTGGLDVAGMPLLAGRVMVVDARKLNRETDMLRTSILPPRSRDIPQVDYHVPLTPVSFARFTRIIPSAARGPTIVSNPMIGPSPFVKGDSRPPVILTFGNRSARATMLLDTGAAFSMISTRIAAQLGVTYSDDGSTLAGIPAKDQFGVTVGGIGGQRAARGFFLDALALPTRQGKPLRYLRAPVLVMDITANDAKANESFTLDGVFGMNFLVASASVDGGGLLPNIGEIRAGAYDFIVIDLAASTLGLKMAGQR